MPYNGIYATDQLPITRRFNRRFPKLDMEIFGEISWVTRRKRTATVRCRGEVEAIRIDGKSLMRYLEDHHKVGFEVMRKISMLLAERMVATDTLLKQILWNSTL